MPAAQNLTQCSITHQVILNLTHKQACLQAITVATVNSTYDWMANKARRTLEDVLDVRARDRRPKLPPPVAQSGRAGAGVEREAEARPVA